MTIRSATYIGTVTLLSQLLLSQGCGSNNPSTTGAAGTTGTAGAMAGTPAAGSTGAAAGTPTAGTSGAAGAMAGTPAAGSTGIPNTTAAGGAAGALDTTPAGGAGGAASAPNTTPSGGTIAVAGTTGTSSGGTTAASTGAFDPLCSTLLTAAAALPTKGGVCTATDPQLCYKTCGPKSVGFKSETCLGGTYQEQTGCSFPTGIDYSCYKIPATIDPSCPTTVPQANTPCTVADCVPCNVNGGYNDSSGAAKTGYCVCPATAAGTPGKWTCASTTAWPCPAGQGC